MTSESKIHLNQLEARVDTLERRIGQRIDEASGAQQSIVDTLILVNDKMRALTAGRDRFNSNFNFVHTKLSEYEDMITNPEIILQRADESMIVERILTEEDRLLREAKLLEDITSKQKLLDSKAVRDHEQLAPRLAEVRVNTLRQLETSRRLNAETRRLIGTYNDVMQVLNGQLAKWDTKLKTLEARGTKAGSKPVLEEFD